MGGFRQEIESAIPALRRYARALTRNVELAVPPGTSSGRTFRLKGKGFPAKDGKGDLLAAVRIVLPEGGDMELDELMRKWRKTKPHDPRKDMG